ncbi:MAG: transketolase C-terminal domain-containing protein, partial [Candidatus Bathyarchaeota archaeon]
LTVRAFNLAERLRTPVMLMADGMIGHIKEKIIIPDEVETLDRKRPTGNECTPFGTEDASLVPEMPRFGDGYKLLVTGSCHRPTGVRDYSPKYHQMKVNRIREKILRAEEELRDVESVDLDDCEIAVISFGASARPSYGAVKRARADGIKAGLLRLRTIWPFPEDLISELSERIDTFLVVEMNVGKLVREVERVACGRAEVVSVSKIGGVLPTVEEIHRALRRAT